MYKKRILSLISGFKAVFSFAALAAFAALVMTGCATKFTLSDPFNYGTTEGTAILRVHGTKGYTSNFAKINGTVLPSNEIVVKAGTTEYEIKIIMQNAYGSQDTLVYAKTSLDLDAGKTYLLRAEYTDGFKARRAWLGIAAGPAVYNIVLYEYSGDLKNKREIVKIPASNLELKDF